MASEVKNSRVKPYSLNILDRFGKLAGSLRVEEFALDIPRYATSHQTNSCS